MEPEFGCDPGENRKRREHSNPRIPACNNSTTFPSEPLASLYVSNSHLGRVGSFPSFLRAIFNRAAIPMATIIAAKAIRTAGVVCIVRSSTAVVAGREVYDLRKFCNDRSKYLKGNVCMDRQGKQENEC
jgi:hypothetical protein